MCIVFDGTVWEGRFSAASLSLNATASSSARSRSAASPSIVEIESNGGSRLSPRTALSVSASPMQYYKS